MTNDERDNEEVVAPPPLIYAGFLVLGLLLNRRFPAPFLPRGMERILGWPLLGSGMLLAGWFYRTLQRAGTPINPGAGTPTIPEEPVSRLVTDGPFRYSRNPGYLSVAMSYAGVASLANALWAILLLPAALLVIQRAVIEREESYLERKFGAEYLRYQAHVRRWI